MTDATLIDQFNNGQKTAFNIIVKRWECPVYNFILRYIGDADEARDLCQKTFIRAYRNLPTLREPDKFTSWIYQIALNTCKDESRRRTHLSFEALQDIASPTLPSTPPATFPDALAHQQSVREVLNRALQTLPEEQRVVIIMKEYQGLKFTEIADTLKTPINTVKSRLYYGLSALKKIFEQWHITEDMMRYDL